MATPVLLTPKEAATLLSVSLSTFYTNYQDWGIPYFRVGKHLRFKLSELELWLEGQRGL
ncbi:helix-turn-helix domain-containing protein [Kitasatospora acidiphila]|uniref:Helix-turn-helix domain-containing protein n=1 Tax=Kitasatospora acidiphila TaxID=2567942 RepID=A0A540W4E8_9ACTN|nr:helix-turn-helix domain-containing protein [Kitasatospora acidiphila]TQF03908.1 helix-turn-helix domain-containing protein [Kitasatospora acidiphila]